MKKFKVDYVGYDTIGWGKVEKTEIVMAEDEKTAEQQITSRSCMGGYDYFVERIVEVNE